jgi:competence protein ComEA
MRLSNEERRALGIILGLLVVSAAARWMERPRPLLDDVPAMDVAALEEESRAARPASSRRAGGGPGGTAGGAAGAGARAAPVRIDPNTATVVELQRLPGVGPAMAQRIMEEREQGAFVSMADLQRVRGIGPALAAKLAEHVTLPAATEPAAAAAAGRSGGAGAAGPGGMSGGGTSMGAGMSPPQSQPQLLDLNRAGSAELQRVPGIGPALAGRLISRRDSLGGFREWSQVDAVPGIGPAMLARLMAHARLAP